MLRLLLECLLLFIERLSHHALKLGKFFFERHFALGCQCYCLVRERREHLQCVVQHITR